MATATEELKVTQYDREILIRCVADACEGLRIVPGVDANGPMLVWLADHLLELHRTGQQASAKR